MNDFGEKDEVADTDWGLEDSVVGTSLVEEPKTEFGKNTVKIAKDNSFGITEVAEDYDTFNYVENEPYDPSEAPKVDFDTHSQEIVDDNFNDMLLKSFTQAAESPEVKRQLEFQKQQRKVIQDYFNIITGEGLRSRYAYVAPVEDIKAVTGAAPTPELFGKLERRKYTTRQLVYGLSDEDLMFAQSTIQREFWEYPPEVVGTVNKEVKTRQAMQIYKNMSRESQFEYAVIAAFNPFGIRNAMALFGVNADSPAVTEAIARTLAEENEVSPVNVLRLADFGGNVLNIATEFWALGKVAPAQAEKALMKLPEVARPLVKTGVKFAARAALQYPREGETLKQREEAIKESFLFGAAMGYIGEKLPLARYRVPVEATGIPMYVLMKGGTPEEAIESVAMVIGFESLNLAQKAYKAGKGRVRNLYADKAVKAARAHNPELFKMSNREVKIIIEQQMRHLKEAGIVKDIAHKNARQDAKIFLKARREGNDNLARSIVDKYTTGKAEKPIEKPPPLEKAAIAQIVAKVAPEIELEGEPERIVPPRTISRRDLIRAADRAVGKQRIAPSTPTTPTAVTGEIKAPEAQPPAEKQAWEMTKGEFSKIAKVEENPYYAYAEEGKKYYNATLGRSGNYNQTSPTEAINGLREFVIETAIDEGEPVPRNVLEEYKGKKWADEALAKPKEPTGLKAEEEALLGGVPQEPPGLTRAELESMGKTVKKPPGLMRRPPYKLRKGEQPITQEQIDSLKAKGFTLAEISRLSPKEAMVFLKPSPKEAMREAQAEGKKIGYKMGQREAIEDARRKMAVMKIQGLVEKKSKQDALEVIKRFVPKEKQYLYTNRLLKVMTPEKVNKLAGQIEEYIERADQREAVRSLKNTWSEIQKEYRFGKVILGKLDDIARERILSLMDKVDTIKLSEAKEDDLESLAGYVNRLGGVISGEITTLNSDVEAILKIPDSRIESLKRLEKLSAADMTADDIRALEQELQFVIRQHELKNKIITRMGAEDLREKRDAAISEIRPSPKVEKSQGTIDTIEGRKMTFGKVVKDVLYLSSAHSDTLVERITNADPTTETFKLLVTDLWEGENKEISLLMSARETAQELQGQYGLTVKDWDALDEEIKVKIGGKEVKIKLDDALGMYMNSRNPGNLKRWLKAMATASGKKEYPVPTSQELNDITSQIPEILKNWRNVFKGVNNNVQAPAINNEFKILNGFPKAVNPDFYPTARKFPRRVRGTKAELSVSIENEGRYQPITGGKEVFRIIPFREAFLNGIQMDAKLYGMAIPMRNARTLLGNREWQESVIKSGYEEEMNALIDLTENYQNFKTDTDILEKTGQKLLNRWAQAILNLRIKTIGTQICSLPAAIEGMDAKYVKPPVLITKERIDRMKKHPFFWLRWQLNRYNIELGAVAAEHMGKQLFFDKTPILEKGLEGMLWGDQEALGNIHRWAESEILNKTNLQEGTPEFEETVNKRTEFLVRRNQPAWSYLNRSKLGSSKSLLARSTLMFRSAVEAQYNVLMRHASQYVKSAKDSAAKMKFAKAYGAVLSSIVAVTLWKATFTWAVHKGIKAILSNWFGIWQPEKEAKEVAKDVAVDMGKNLISLAPAGRIVGNAAETVLTAALTGKRMKRFNTGNPLIDVGTLSVDLATNFALATNDYLSGAQDAEGENQYKKELLRAIDNTLELASVATGAPYTGPMQEFGYPFTKRSDHSIIKNMKVGDIDKPSEFATKVEEFYKKRKELKDKVDNLLFPGWKDVDILEKYPSPELLPQSIRDYLEFNSIANTISEYGNYMKDEIDIYKRREIYNQIEMMIDYLKEKD